MLKLLVGRDKVYVTESLKKLYSDEALITRVDQRFERLLQLFDRLRKSFTIQNEALNDILDRLDILHRRKVAAMVKGPEYM